MPKWDFNKVAKHIFRTTFPTNTSGCLLLISTIFEALVLPGIRFQILAPKFAIDSLQIQAVNINVLQRWLPLLSL